MENRPFWRSVFILVASVVIIAILVTLLPGLVQGSTPQGDGWITPEPWMGGYPVLGGTVDCDSETSISGDIVVVSGSDSTSLSVTFPITLMSGVNVEVTVSLGEQ